MKSRAMVAVVPNQLELQEFDVVPPTSEQILIKTKVTSVCSTDVKILLRGLLKEPLYLTNC